MNLRLIAHPIVLAWLTSCVVVSPVPDMTPGAHPAPDTDEAGLWREMDVREYHGFLTSGEVIQDPELQAYLESVLCRVVPEYCRDIRIYVLPSRGIGAAMMPNGAMLVTTGALLRWGNEAQMASVFGHEVAHYAERHSLVSHRSLRSILNTTGTFASVVVAGVGVAAATRHGHLAGAIFRGGFASYVGLWTAYVFNVLHYSRERESEADSIGRSWTVSAGYDVGTDSQMWALMESELEAAPIDPPPVLLRSHPKPATRALSAKEDADNFRRERPDANRLGTEEYMQRIEPFRHEWLQHARGGLPPELDALLIERQREIGVGPGLVLFHEAQMFRKRNDEGDQALAVATFREALGHEDHPPETHRELGLALWVVGETGEARQAFHRYLTDHPDALDRTMIRHYMEQLPMEEAGE